MATGRFQKGTTPWNKGKQTGISPANKKEKVFISCKQCGRDFGVQPYRKDTALFCSHSCVASFNMTGEKHHQWKGGKPKCEVCEIKLSNYNNKRCAEHAVLTGERNGLWVADRTKLKKYEGSEEKRSPAYKAWRKSVCDRDKWPCRIADNNCDGRLEVHHILPWSKFPELRYEVNNGISLCHFHHPRKRNDEMRLSPYFLELVKSN